MSETETVFLPIAIDVATFMKVYEIYHQWTLLEAMAVSFGNSLM
jgi:hypothetical protein